MRGRIQCTMSHRIGQLLHYHLRFYQLLGLHGLPLSGDEQTQSLGKLLRLWAFLLLAVFSGLTLMCVASDEDFLYSANDMGYFNDALKFCFAEIAIVSIYCESIWQRGHLERFWHLYELFAVAQQSHSPVGTLRQQLVRHSRFLFTLYGTLLTELLSLGLLLSLQVFSKHLLLFWITFQPFVLVVHLRNTQFVLHLELLRQQLVQLERELALLVEYTGFASGAASFDGFAEYLRRRLHQKQLVYTRIYELATYFTTAFSYSMLTVPLMIYVRVAVDFYFMLYTLYNNVNNIDYILLVPAILEVPALIWASQSCMQMVPRIVHQLHNIVCSSTELSRQIQNFSLQILHQSLRIDCLGMTVLDNYLLTRIACAVCTYIIFTLQLMPKVTTSYI